MSFSDDNIRRRNKEDNLRAIRAIGRFDASNGRGPRKISDFKGNQEAFDRYIEGYRESAESGPQGPFDKTDRSRSKSLRNWGYIWAAWCVITSTVYLFLHYAANTTSIEYLIASWASLIIGFVLLTGSKIIRYLEDLHQ